MDNGAIGARSTNPFVFFIEKLSSGDSKSNKSFVIKYD